MSPINPSVIQRRHAELGRIRLGDKGAKGQPQKLTKFRLTSPNQRLIEAVASLYGGQCQRWDNAGKAEWECYTDATSLPVIVVKGGISQWLESWSGGGCVRRCDGEREMLSDGPCICDGEQGDRRCKPTTRLSVMLRDLDVIGVWRCESHGWNSAAELPGLVELAQHVGDLVPANLVLHERVTIRDGKTNRFIVPGLDLGVSPARLSAIVMGQEAPAVTAHAAPEAIAYRTAELSYRELVESATTEEELRGIWRQAGEAGQLDEALKAYIKARSDEFHPLVSAEIHALDPSPPAQPGGESVDDLWFRIVAAAGERGWTDEQVRLRFKGTAGCDVADATVDQLILFLATVRAGAAS